MRLALPTSRDRYRLRLAQADVFCALAAPFIALALREPALLSVESQWPWLSQPYIFALLTFPCALASFLFFRISESFTHLFCARDAFRILAAVTGAVALSSLVAFTLTRLEGVPRSTPVIYGLVLAAGLVSTRLIARLLFRHQPAPHAPENVADFRRIVIVGADHFSAAAIRLIDCQTPRTTIVAAALDAHSTSVGRKVGGVKIVGTVNELDDIVAEYQVHGVVIDEVWLSDSAVLAPEELARMQLACAARNLPLVTISEALNLTPGEPKTCAETGETPREPDEYFEIKRVLDVVGAGVLLAVLSPVALVIALLVYLDVGAPVLFWQQRLGMHGRKFLLYKFRTYQAPFDRLGQPIPGEQRVSKIGHAIRASRLDEIPQLYSVLIGDMSLIGPRPLLPHDQPSDPRMRLLVRPGITGWAQINGGRIITPEEKDALDTWYIRHASLALDIRILLNTVVIVLTGEKKNHIALQNAIDWRGQNQPAAKSDEPKGVA